MIQKSKGRCLKKNSSTFHTQNKSSSKRRVKYSSKTMKKNVDRKGSTYSYLAGINKNKTLKEVINKRYNKLCQSKSEIRCNMKSDNSTNEQSIHTPMSQFKLDLTNTASNNIQEVDHSPIDLIKSDTHEVASTNYSVLDQVVGKPSQLIEEVKTIGKDLIKESGIVKFKISSFNFLDDPFETPEDQLNQPKQTDFIKYMNFNSEDNSSFQG